LNNKNEILVGALTLFGIVLFILGFKFLQGDDIFTRSKFVNIVADRVDGIAPSSPVLENGVPIGRVDNIELSTNPKYLNKAILTLKLEKGVIIPNDSKFVIYGLDMLGKMGVGLSRGTATSKAATELDTMLCLVKGNSIDQGVDLVKQLKPKIDSVLGSVYGLANNLNTQLGTGDNALIKKAVSDLSTTMQSINRLAGNADKMIVGLNGTLTENKGNIDGILKNVSQLTGKLNGETGKIDSILTNFKTLSSKLAALELASTVESAKGTLDELKKTLKLVTEGDGSVAKLLKDDGLYKDLTKAVNAFGSVMTDLQAHPKKYINLAIFDKSKSYTVADTTLEQFLKNNPKAAKAAKVIK